MLFGNECKKGPLDLQCSADRGQKKKPTCHDRAPRKPGSIDSRGVHRQHECANGKDSTCEEDTDCEIMYGRLLVTTHRRLSRKGLSQLRSWNRATFYLGSMSVVSFDRVSIFDPPTSSLYICRLQAQIQGLGGYEVFSKGVI